MPSCVSVVITDPSPEDIKHVREILGKYEHQEYILKKIDPRLKAEFVEVDSEMFYGNIWKGSV